MKKRVCFIVLIGFLLVGSLSVAAETYKLGILPVIGWSEYRVAEVKGFWEKQGISVELVDYATPIDTNRGGIQRRVDLKPVPMATIGMYRNEGVFDAVYLGTFSIADHHKDVIIKKDLITKSLKGQTIGMFLIDPSNKFLLSTYLKTVNTSLADVRLMTMNSHDELEASFIRDRLAVVLALDRGNNFYEQANGVVALSTHDFYEPHGLIAIRKDPLKTIPPEDLKKILRGCVEAIQWIRDPANWEEYKGILKQYFLAGRSDLSDEQFRALTQEGKFFDPQTLLAHNQQQLRDYFAQVRNFLASEEIVNADVLDAFTYDNVIHNQALIEVLQEYGQ